MQTFSAQSLGLAMCQPTETVQDPSGLSLRVQEMFLSSKLHRFL